jgi:hypothetical protein
MRVLFMVVASALGAWAQKVTIEFDQGADFGKYKTSPSAAAN